MTTESEMLLLDIDDLVELIKIGNMVAIEVGERRLKVEALSPGQEDRLRRALRPRPGWPPRGEVRAVLAPIGGSGYQLVIGNRSLSLDAVDVFNPDYLLKTEWTWNVKLTAQGQIRAEPVPVPKQCRERKKGPPKLGTVNGNA